MVWIETPTNPTMRLVDIASVVKVVKEKAPAECFVVVDNTFMSSYFQVNKKKDIVGNRKCVSCNETHYTVLESCK